MSDLPNYELLTSTPNDQGDIEYIIRDTSGEGPDMKVILPKDKANDPTDGEAQRELMQYFSREVGHILNSWPTIVSLCLESSDIMKDIIDNAQNVPAEVVKRLDEHSEKLFAYLEEQSESLLKA
jgi:hypothetical protein